ncbi:5-methyltetrahydrofolate--homocysteine methyltransferase [Methanosarcina sp. MTP4]|uniref:corrinoid protein n=1 Tax=Methanosarcina sp. MTP4 TaxID=1434100 RepID=UPI0006157852|nr:corrinoid protein [Methanosarcina sp. MTP4]AKB25375.1 5-methyltetrahydrofolate--homocysteine methyltransferase [Methanosarcina sp. MTP4]
MTSKEEIFESLAEAVVKGKQDLCVELANKVIEEKVDAYEAIMKGCAHGMSIVSDKYDKREMFVPHIMIAARAMNSAVEILQPHVNVESAEKPGDVVTGVVFGDVHDIGINLVVSLLGAAGFTVHHLGKDIAPEKFIEAAKEHNADVIGLSALMTTSMMGMKEVVELARGEIPSTKIMIGGGPVSQRYCNDIGADAYAENAPEAIKAVKELVAAKKAN